MRADWYRPRWRLVAGRRCLVFYEPNLRGTSKGALRPSSLHSHATKYFLTLMLLQSLRNESFMSFKIYVRTS